jgi:hypothetical protein
LFALAVLIAGPPATLLAFVGNPVPDQAVVGGQLTDAAVIGILAAIVWAAWAQLMLVIAVEAIAAVRGAALPRRMPLCGFQQHLARHLVVTASLLLAGSGALVATTAVAGPAIAAVAPESAAPYDIVPVAMTPLASLSSAYGLPAVPDVATPSVGNAVPGDQVSVAAPTAELWYVVTAPHGHHHDSLWDIAERHLGDGMRWREIYDLNQHRPQPDGQRLELARLIQPGWRLLMPADATGISPEPTSAVEHQHVGSTRSDEDKATGATSPVPRARVAQDPIGRLSPAATVVGPQTLSTQDAAAADEQSSTADAAVHNEQEPRVPFGALTLGLGALACAGLTAELTRRRRRAQRHRRPGERLQTPSPEAQGAERVIRTANAELTVLGLREALRSLAANCVLECRQLPDVHAIKLNAAGAILLLGTDDAHAVAPFESAGRREWVLDANRLPSPDGTPADDDRLDPLPALVALGVTGDTILLVNLEAAGTLSVDGDPDHARSVLHAMVAELGTSDLTPTVHLGLHGCTPELVATLDAGRVTVLDDEHVAKWAQARSDDVAAILSHAEMPDVAAARSAQIASDVWAPAVLIDAGNAEGQRTHQTPVAEPHGGLCVLATRGSESEDRLGWSLRSRDDGWVLEPLGIELEPQRLALDALPSLVEMLETSIDPAPSTTSSGAPRPETVGGPFGCGPTRAGPPAERDPAVAVERLHAPVAEAIPAFPGESAPPGAAETDLQAPRVLVLGPVDVIGVDAEGAPGRRRRATELVAYLALHPGATQFQVDEALWPGTRVSRNTRNPLVSRTRQWLGTGPDGQPHLGLVGEGGVYTLSAGVTADWHDFCALAKRGLANGPNGIDDLGAALDLVRGRPFLGVNPVTYTWAELDTQDMISAIVDVAHALATLALAGDDPRCARWAASKGLVVDPCAELLYQDAIHAATLVGDQTEARRLAMQLRTRIGELDPADDMGDLTGLGAIGGRIRR